MAPSPPAFVPCLAAGCGRKATRIVVAPAGVNDDLPAHDQLFRELVPHDRPTREKWERDGKVIFENGLPRGRARSRSEYRRMLRDLGRCSPYEGTDGGEAGINERNYNVRQSNRKLVRPIARKQAEKMIEAARKNPHGACGLTAKEIVGKRAKKAGAIRVSE